MSTETHMDYRETSATAPTVYDSVPLRTDIYQAVMAYRAPSSAMVRVSPTMPALAAT